MPPAASASPSPFRLDKRRIEGTLTLTTGRTVRGRFFLAASGELGDGPERVDDLLNHLAGFFPFERVDGEHIRVSLFNAAQVSLITLFGREARDVPGYDVATPRRVALILSDGTRVSGTIRLYLPDGRSRVSDWSHGSATFRYLETDHGTLLVNLHHVVEIIELEHP